MSSASTDTRKYELMVIFSGNLTESAFEKELEDLKKALQEASKGITNEEKWGRREFAYRLNRQKAGYYAVFDFEADPSAIAELRANVKLNPQILRHLLIILPDNYEPGRYRDLVLTRERKDIADKKKLPVRASAEPSVPSAKEAPQKPSAAISEDDQKAQQEKLKSVEKKLEAILDNPNIEIR
ncbi:30S ribosomal protein S6 [Candidatus Peregrinibacteria bacterium]|nr:30S ribosomal protein S6 [Candidatus Peregrinibacteria bacterium]